MSEKNIMVRVRDPECLAYLEFMRSKYGSSYSFVVEKALKELISNEEFEYHANSEVSDVSPSGGDSNSSECSPLPPNDKEGSV